MRQRRNHPWISLLGLTAILGAMLALAAPASTSMAQATSFPGENDPISGRADGLSQFADDELALVSDAVNSTQDAIKAYSPNPDYTMPDGIASDALPKPPPGNLVQNTSGNQRQLSVARGRIVDPARDVAVALTRTGYSPQSHTMSWALQELSFGARHPATPATVPTLTFSSPVNIYHQMAENSPGALALGDLDRIADTKGNPHDEIVLAYERYQFGASGLVLSVQRYDPVSGALVPSVELDPLPDRRAFAYLCGIGWLNKDTCPQNHPGMIDLALADVDGDGFKEVALLAHTQDFEYRNNSLDVFLFSYCPPGLAADDPRVAAGYCSSSRTAPSSARSAARSSLTRAHSMRNGLTHRQGVAAKHAGAGNALLPGVGCLCSMGNSRRSRNTTENRHEAS